MNSASITLLLEIQYDDDANSFENQLYIII